MPQTGILPSALRARASDTSSQGDLIGLATKLADAMGDARLARLRYGRVQSVADQNLVSQDELDVARINLETAEQKIQLLREIACAYLRQAESQMEFLHVERSRLRKHANPDEFGLLSVEGRLRSAKAMYSVLRSLARLKEPGAADQKRPNKRGAENLWSCSSAGDDISFSPADETAGAVESASERDDPRAE